MSEFITAGLEYFFTLFFAEYRSFMHHALKEVAVAAVSGVVLFPDTLEIPVKGTGTGNSRPICAGIVCEIQIFCDLFSRLIWRQTKKGRDQIDHISMSSTAEAVVVVVIDLQAGKAVRMKGADRFAVSPGSDPIKIGSLPKIDGLPDKLKSIQFFCQWR